jgi:hypothetical protein
MTQKRLTIISVILLIAFAAPYIFNALKNANTVGNELKIEIKKSSTGNNYSFFHKDNFNLEVTLTRPDKSDNSILLCIPAAYTDLQTYLVDGLYIENGKIYNKNKINHTLDGAIKIINNECEIFSTNEGKLLNDSLINPLILRKGSLFQQTLLIKKGIVTKFNDQKLFQRRAIVKLKSNEIAVIESFEKITLSDFTNDLLELEVMDALNTDMGAWDEGWYRNPKNNEVLTIGKMNTRTDKQSNWIVFRSK